MQHSTVGDLIQTENHYYNINQSYASESRYADDLQSCPPSTGDNGSNFQPYFNSANMNNNIPNSSILSDFEIQELLRSENFASQKEAFGSSRNQEKTQNIDHRLSNMDVYNSDLFGNCPDSDVEVLYNNLSFEVNHKLKDPQNMGVLNNQEVPSSRIDVSKDEVCPLCCKSFRGRQHTIRHLKRMHLAKDSLQCVYCLLEANRVMFSSKSCLLDHIKKNHSYRKESSAKNNPKGSSPPTLENVVQSNIPAWVKAPESIVEKNSSLNKLVNYKAGNADERLQEPCEVCDGYFCPLCNMKLQKKSHILIEHLLKIHGKDPKFKCKLCKEVVYFITYQSYKTHLLFEHNGISPSDLNSGVSSNYPMMDTQVKGYCNCTMCNRNSNLDKFSCFLCPQGEGSNISDVQAHIEKFHRNFELSVDRHGCQILKDSSSCGMNEVSSTVLFGEITEVRSLRDERAETFNAINENQIPQQHQHMEIKLEKDENENVKESNNYDLSAKTFPDDSDPDISILRIRNKRSNCEVEFCEDEAPHVKRLKIKISLKNSKKDASSESTSTSISNEDLEVLSRSDRENDLIKLVGKNGVPETTERKMEALRRCTVINPTENSRSCKIKITKADSSNNSSSPENFKDQIHPMPSSGLKQACSLCGAGFLNDSELTQHLSKCNKNESNPAKLCVDRTSSESGESEQHLLQSFLSERTCPFCGKYKTMLLSHMRRAHKLNQLFMCTHCEECQFFCTKESLQKHITRKHADAISKLVTKAKTEKVSGEFNNVAVIDLTEETPSATKMIIDIESSIPDSNNDRGTVFDIKNQGKQSRSNSQQFNSLPNASQLSQNPAVRSDTNSVCMQGNSMPSPHSNLPQNSQSNACPQPTLPKNSQSNACPQSTLFTSNTFNHSLNNVNKNEVNVTIVNKFNQQMEHPAPDMINQPIFHPYQQNYPYTYPIISNTNNPYLSQPLNSNDYNRYGNMANGCVNNHPSMYPHVGPAPPRPPFFTDKYGYFCQQQMPQNLPQYYQPAYQNPGPLYNMISTNCCPNCPCRNSIPRSVESVLSSDRTNT